MSLSECKPKIQASLPFIWGMKCSDEDVERYPTTNLPVKYTNIVRGETPIFFRYGFYRHFKINAVDDYLKMR